MSSRRSLAAALAALGLLATGAPQATAQVRVSALGFGDLPLTTSPDVRVSLFADFEERVGVAIDDRFEAGDLLSSLADELFLELTCPGGSLLQFSGRFRVLINPPREGVDCAVDFLNGKLDVLTDKGTEVNAGGKVMGSEGTRYAVRLDRRRAVSAQRLLVFEGAVWVRSATGEARLERGQQLSFSTRSNTLAVPTRVSEAEIATWAKLYARFDVVKWQAAEEQVSELEATARSAHAVELRAQLTTLHAEVLRQPDDTAKRKALAEAQLEARLPTEAIYNLEKAGVPEIQLRELKNPAALRGISHGSAAEIERLRRVIRPETELRELDRRRLVPDGGGGGG